MVCFYHTSHWPRWSIIILDPCRVRQISEFGLNLKWYENAKIARSEWKIALKKSGKYASCQYAHFIKMVTYRKIFFSGPPCGSWVFWQARVNTADINSPARSTNHGMGFGHRRSFYGMVGRAKCGGYSKEQKACHQCIFSSQITMFHPLMKRVESDESNEQIWHWHRNKN